MLRRALIALPLAIVTLALIDLGSWFALPCAIHPVAEGGIERNAQHNNSENACPFQGGSVAAGLIKMAQWTPEAWTAAATLILAVFTLVLAAVTREHVKPFKLNLSLGIGPNCEPTRLRWKIEICRPENQSRFYFLPRI